MSRITVVGTNSFSDNNSGNPIGASAPAGSNGDLLICFTNQRNDMSTPTSYTQLLKITLTSSVFAIYWKIATGTNDGVSFAAAGGGGGGLVRFAGADQTTPILTSAQSAAGSGTTVAGASISPTTEPLLVICAVGNQGAGTTTQSGYSVVTSDPGGWVEAFDVSPFTGTFYHACAAATVGWAHTGSTGNASSTFSRSQTQSYITMLALQPAQYQATVLSGNAIAVVDPARTLSTTRILLSMAAALGTPVSDIATQTWASVKKATQTWVFPNKP